MQNSSQLEPVFGLKPARIGLVWVERAGEMAAVEHRRVDRLLQVEAEDGMGQKEIQRPLVLLVAARRAERQPRLSAASHEVRAQGRPRPFAALERVWMAFVEVEHLGSRAQAEAEPPDHGRALQPAAA